MTTELSLLRELHTICHELFVPQELSSSQLDAWNRFADKLHEVASMRWVDAEIARTEAAGAKLLIDKGDGSSPLPLLAGFGLEVGETVTVGQVVYHVTRVMDANQYDIATVAKEHRDD